MLVDLQYWYPSLCASNDGSPGEQCPLISMSQGRQSCITGFPRSICWRRTKPITQPLTWPHPWQYNPPLLQPMSLLTSRTTSLAYYRAPRGGTCCSGTAAS
jgi:hypothetical protein